jgi:hypothetical protein
MCVRAIMNVRSERDRSSEMMTGNPEGTQTLQVAP